MTNSTNQRLTEESLTAPSTLVVASAASGLERFQGRRIPLSGSLTTTRGVLRVLATADDEVPASLVVVGPSVGAGGSHGVPPGTGMTCAHGGAPYP